MPMTGTIDLVDGVPHVKYVTTDWTEPIRVTLWWPLPAATGRVEQGAACWSDGSGWLVSAPIWGSLRFGMPNGGQTEAVRRTEEPVPPPRTRCETRWHNGRWEKLLARKGWVAA